jgi:DNA end-binding protein Ku
MAARPSWEGHLRLSLVTCPVALWPATTKAETVRFNLINPKTNNRIRMQTLDAGAGEEVSRSDLVKGYQIAKGEYVLFDKDELDAVKLGRLVMSTRERICGIEIEEGGLVLTTLRTAEEVRSLDEVARPDLPKPDAAMLQIAEKIVEQQSGDFDPSEFRDRYEDALRALIDDKRKGKPARPTKPANDDGKVIDLMAALKKSLESGGGSRQRAESVPATKGKNTKKPG